MPHAARSLIEKIVLSPNKKALTWCLCFISGVGIGSIINIGYRSVFFLFCSIIFLVLLAPIFWSRFYLRFILSSALFICVGFWRVASVDTNCSQASNICFYNENKVVVRGHVAREPDIRIDKVQYVLAVKNIITPNKQVIPVSGNVLLKTKLYPRYAFGENIEFGCRLQKPENNFDSVFEYDKYLAKERVWSMCSFPEYSIFFRDTHTSVKTKFLQPIFLLKARITAQMARLWPEPENSFMAGLLYGSKSGLPPTLMDNFSKTGVTHIIAVSGFNVTIIVVVLERLLVTLGLHRRRAFWVVLGILAIFVVFTGATASVVRAALMASVVLVAKYIGRTSSVGMVLVFVAAGMNLVNPYLLMWDAGFQLSFLATFGLIYISPMLEKFFHKITKNKLINAVIAIFTQTMGAIIATLPLILYQFGRLSLVAPLVNVLVLWIIPWLMLGGFISLVLSFIFFPLGQLVAHLFWFGLEYVILVVNFFGNLPWAAVNISIPWWAMLIAYFGMIGYITKDIKIFSMSKTAKLMNSFAGYNLAAEGYDAREKYLNSFEQGKLLPLVGDVKGKKVLDVGAGTGRVAIKLQLAGAEVTAIDISEEMLKVLTKKNKHVTTILQDAEDLPFPEEEFDVVVATFLIVHFKKLERFFDEAYRVLKPGGTFVVTNINQKDPPVIKTRAGEIIIESFYHRPESVIKTLQSLAFSVEKEEFVKEGDQWINQIVVAKK